MKICNTAFFFCLILLASWSFYSDRCANADPASPCLRPSNDSPSLQKATDVINASVLTGTNNQPKFLIHGWRWHTLSLIRDLKRLHQFTEDIFINTDAPNAETVNQLESAYDFVVNFNMKALHRIEEKTFFPWIRKKFLILEKPADSKDHSNEDIQHALKTVLLHLDQERDKVRKLGLALKDQVHNIRMSFPKNDQKELSCVNNSHDQQFLSNVSLLLVQLYTSVENSYQLQQISIVPCIANRVSLSEQKALNNQVLKTLGILESRTHLVGMYDTICSIPNTTVRKEELNTFQDVIPWLPKKMIPRWRTSLYEPKIGLLNSYS